MYAFQVPDSPLTLAEGLAEYYARTHGLKRGEALPAKARDFFRSHDVVHVVFGCDTSLAQEAVVKLSSLFGSTDAVSVMKGYLLYDSLDIYRRLPMGEVLETIVRAIVIVPRTLARCLRQTRRWPWAGFEPYLDQPLSQIRSDFGIRV